MLNFFFSKFFLLSLVVYFYRFKINKHYQIFFIFCLLTMLVVSLPLLLNTNSLYNWKLTNFVFDLMGFSLFVLSSVTSVFCLFFLDLKIVKWSRFLGFGFIYINCILFIYFFTNNFFLFFLSYEFLLIPSVLLSYISSPNLRSKNVSFYFLLWTQLGSFLVFLAVLLLITKLNTFSFINFFCLHLNTKLLVLIKVLIFLGFGIKIPMWPFHFWLTKTHVEVNTSFSIFLSGILVKTALFGFYKFSYLFLWNNFFFIIICFIGILDSSVKLFAQVDLKKIVAYCTIFEMNIILSNFFFFSYYSYLFFIYFSILHTLLSFFFFFSVDCIYRRFNTRSIQGVNNLLNYYPNFAIFLIIGVMMFNGIPLTLKFNLELVFFAKILNYSFLYFFVFIIIQVIAIIFFTKNFFSILFFSTNSKVLVDLTTKELCIFNVLFIFFILFSFF